MAVGDRSGPLEGRRPQVGSRFWRLRAWGLNFLAALVFLAWPPFVGAFLWILAAPGGGECRGGFFCLGNGLQYSLFWLGLGLGWTGLLFATWWARKRLRAARRRRGAAKANTGP